MGGLLLTPFGFLGASAVSRLVCSWWKAVHDARLSMIDEAVSMQVRRFPAVTSVARIEWAVCSCHDLHLSTSPIVARWWTKG
jgi:hypothetical protein